MIWMMTTALALTVSLALESGVGTLSIIHHLHGFSFYIENKTATKLQITLEKGKQIKWPLNNVQHFILHYT